MITIRPLSPPVTMVQHAIELNRRYKPDTGVDIARKYAHNVNVLLTLPDTVIMDILPRILSDDVCCANLLPDAKSARRLLAGLLSAHNNPKTSRIIKLIENNARNAGLENVRLYNY